MTDSNNKLLNVMLSDEQLSQLTDRLYSELNKLPLYDKNGRTKIIKTILNIAQDKIVRNINQLDDEQAAIVKELIAYDLLCK